MRGVMTVADLELEGAVRRLDEGHPTGTHAACGILGHYYDPCDIRRVLDALREAQAEIERLRGLFVSTCESRDAWIKQCDKAEVEATKRCEELRRALQRYVDEDTECEYGGLDTCPGVPSFPPCRLHAAREVLRSTPVSECLCAVGWRHCPIHQDDGREPAAPPERCEHGKLWDERCDPCAPYRSAHEPKEKP